MAIGLMFKGPGVTDAQYKDVLNRVAPGGKFPSGNLYHAAGPYEGGLCVIEIWDSHESLSRFHQEKLGAALQEAGVAGDITIFEVSNEVRP